MLTQRRVPSVSLSQHVLLGLVAFVSSTCGLVLLSLTRSELRREAAAILARHPLGSVRAFQTTQTTHVLASRLPAATLYVGLAAAMLSRVHGEPFSDHLHFAFAVYCILYGVSKLVGVSPWVHIAPSPSPASSVPAGAATIPSSIRSVGGVAWRGISTLGAEQDPSRRHSHPTGSELIASSDHQQHQSAAAGTASWSEKTQQQAVELAPKAATMAESPSNRPAPVAHADEPPAGHWQDEADDFVVADSSAPAAAAFVVDWSATDGVESAGRLGLLSTYLLLTGGITFSASKSALVAASQNLSPGAYVVTLGLVGLVVLTWLTALIEGALQARARRSPPPGGSRAPTPTPTRPPAHRGDHHGATARLEARRGDGVGTSLEKV